MSVLLVGQEIVHYEVLGRGQPLLFLHSWVGSWRYWIDTMQTLSSRFRTYALDLWGFGDTAKVVDRYSLDQQVGLVREFIQQMGICKCSIVGHGLGAVIAVLLALKDPDLVDKLLSVECPLDGTYIDEKLKRNSPSQLFDWLAPSMADMELIRMDAVKSDPKANDISFTSLDLLDWSEIWRKLRAPLVFVQGRNDPAVFDPNPEVDFPETIHKVYFEHSGHFPMLDESSRFSRLLFDFFTLPSGESLDLLQTKEEWKRRLR